MSSDSIEVSIQCPKCGKDLSKTIGWLKKHNNLVCCTCGMTLSTEHVTKEFGATDKPISES